MRQIKRYLRIFYIFFKASLARDISFRLSFFTHIIGAFCYVGLSYFIIFFLMQNISIGKWGKSEMWVLLGCFYIVYYSMFYFFYRGFSRLVKNIHFGYLDYFLLKPVDSQFLTSSLCGGIHNLFAVLFGIGVLIVSVLNLGIPIGIEKIILVALALLLSIFDLYSLFFLLITLNFRFGYLEEVISIILNFQDLSRYPMEAFSKLPLFLMLVALPFSAISTVPADILISSGLPLFETTVFFIISICFIYLVRINWFKSLKNYTSSS